MVLRPCFHSFKAMISIKYLSKTTVKAAFSNCFLTSGAQKRNRRPSESWCVSRPAETEQHMKSPVCIVQFFFGERNHELLVWTAVRSTLFSAVLFTSSLFDAGRVELQILGVDSQWDWWYWRDVDGHYIQTRCWNRALHWFDGTRPAPHEVCPPLLPMLSDDRWWKCSMLLTDWHFAVWIIVQRVHLAIACKEVFKRL